MYSLQKIRRSITPTYRLEVKANVKMTKVWKGKVSAALLEKHITDLNQSFMPNGVNAHVRKYTGFVVYVSSAKVIRQSTGDVVAEWKAPAFQVI